MAACAKRGHSAIGCGYLICKKVGRDGQSARRDVKARIFVGAAALAPVCCCLYCNPEAPGREVSVCYAAKTERLQLFVRLRQPAEGVGVHPERDRQHQTVIIKLTNKAIHFFIGNPPLVGWNRRFQYRLDCLYYKKIETSVEVSICHAVVMRGFIVGGKVLFYSLRTSRG